MGAIVGYLLGEAFTVPSIAEPRRELAERVRSRIGIDLEPGAGAGARPD